MDRIVHQCTGLSIYLGYYSNVQEYLSIFVYYGNVQEYLSIFVYYSNVQEYLSIFVYYSNVTGVSIYLYLYTIVM